MPDKHKVIALVRGEDFRAVYRRAEARIQRKGFLLLCRRNDLPHTARFGSALGRKFVRSSVRRNFIKRQMRAMMRTHGESVDMVLTTKSPIYDLPKEEIRDTLRDLVHQALRRSNK